MLPDLRRAILAVPLLAACGASPAPAAPSAANRDVASAPPTASVSSASTAPATPPGAAKSAPDADAGPALEPLSDATCILQASSNELLAPLPLRFHGLTFA